MHTYRENGYGFEVIFETSSDCTAVHQFKTEDEAAAYVSYLNGGTEPRLVQRELALGIRR